MYSVSHTIKKINIIDISRYISILLFLTSTVIFPRVFDMTGEYASYINLLKVITAFYNLGVFLLLFKSRKDYFLYTFFVSCLALIILNITFLNFLLFVLVLFAYGGKFKNIKAYLYSKIVLVSIIFILSYWGLNSINNIDEIGRSIRYTLGFTNPNTASMMVFDIILGLIYFYNKNKKVIILSFFPVFVVFLFTDSRTLLFVYIIFIFLLTVNSKILIIWKNIITRLFLICFTISVIIAFLYKTDLNLILNRRPYMMYEFLNYYNINFFGHSKNNLVISVDNSYLRILIELGLIYFLIHSLLIKQLLKKLFINKDYLGVKIIIAILFYDIFEQFTIAHGSILLVFVSNYLIDRNVLKESGNKIR